MDAHVTCESRPAWRRRVSWNRASIVDQEPIPAENKFQSVSHRQRIRWVAQTPRRAQGRSDMMHLDVSGVSVVPCIYRYRCVKLAHIRCIHSRLSVQVTVVFETGVRTGFGRDIRILESPARVLVRYRSFRIESLCETHESPCILSCFTTLKVM